MITPGEQLEILLKQRDELLGKLWGSLRRLRKELVFVVILGIVAVVLGFMVPPLQWYLAAGLATFAVVDLGLHVRNLLHYSKQARELIARYDTFRRNIERY